MGWMDSSFYLIFYFFKQQRPWKSKQIDEPVRPQLAELGIEHDLTRSDLAYFELDLIWLQTINTTRRDPHWKWKHRGGEFYY